MSQLYHQQLNSFQILWKKKTTQVDTKEYRGKICWLISIFPLPQVSTLNSVGKNTSHFKWCWQLPLRVQTSIVHKLRRAVVSPQSQDEWLYIHCGSGHELGRSLNLSGMTFPIVHVTLDFPKKASSGGKNAVDQVINLKLAASPRFFLPVVK